MDEEDVDEGRERVTWSFVSPRKLVRLPYFRHTPRLSYPREDGDDLQVVRSSSQVTTQDPRHGTHGVIRCLASGTDGLSPSRIGIVLTTCDVSTLTVGRVIWSPSCSTTPV